MTVGPIDKYVHRAAWLHLKTIPYFLNFHIVILDTTCFNSITVVLFWDDFMWRYGMWLYSARLMTIKILLFLSNAYYKNNKYKFHKQYHCFERIYYNKSRNCDTFNNSGPECDTLYCKDAHWTIDVPALWTLMPRANPLIYFKLENKITEAIFTFWIISLQVWQWQWQWKKLYC